MCLGWTDSARFSDMSYILDALRKSESERRQGRVPDLGQQVQLIHKPKKRSSAVLMWVGIGLVLNAVVLAVLFWPQQTSVSEPALVAPEPEPKTQEKALTESNNTAPEAASTNSKPASQKADEQATVKRSAQDSESVQEAEVAQTEAAEPVPAPAQSGERPTIIVPSRQSTMPAQQTSEPEPAYNARHLVEMPLAFQKSVPDLVFNSHIYASAPSSRRVMINGHYLKTGDSFSGIRVEQITEEGVVLSKAGQRFRVGSVRNWVSPN